MLHRGKVHLGMRWGNSEEIQRKHTDRTDALSPSPVLSLRDACVESVSIVSFKKSGCGRVNTVPPADPRIQLRSGSEQSIAACFSPSLSVTCKVPHLQLVNDDKLRGSSLWSPHFPQDGRMWKDKEYKWSFLDSASWSWPE